MPAKTPGWILGQISEDFLEKSPWITGGNTEILGDISGVIPEARDIPGWNEF